MQSDDLDPRFFTKERAAGAEAYSSDQEGEYFSPPQRQPPTGGTLASTRRSSNDDSSLQLREVLSTYNSHATCALQATRGLKHYIAKLEELVGECGVPEAWEVRPCHAASPSQRLSLLCAG